MIPIDRKRAVVLVAEDEPLLRMMAVDLVEEAGFEAAEAADATEAIEILESRADVRIVFSDIDMPPGLDGLGLAALIRRRWPPIAVILTSGKLRPRTDEMPMGGVFFSKPYREVDVLATMRRMSV